MENINRALVTNDLVQDLKWDAKLREQFADEQDKVLDKYELSPEERKAIKEKDFHTLYQLGLHPYLGAQFARILFSNNESGAVPAVHHLLASIRKEPLKEE
ncbi:hypothetical protein ACXZ66_00875 [Corynebacterium sp. S7]